MKLSLVAYLDDDSQKQIRKLQEGISKATGSRASLDSWQPHITLGDGVEIDGVQFINFLSKMTDALKDAPRLSVQIGGIGSLDDRIGGEGEITTPYAIYLHVAVTPELDALCQTVAAATAGVPKWYTLPVPFTPHVTLAFRDLDDNGYVKGLRYLIGKETTFTATISSVSLVEKLENVDAEAATIQLQ